eukprot:TRINITY_DN20626_c0_g1_i1.p2 TRINITY_DN20626_c0_g1~~TRINITY_DN20626_c0_g1_i1.p2  ORF type:complete len:125 (+),score=18.36 TRINITY_DN20626_c0_g1_i1:97-471(+)
MAETETCSTTMTDSEWREKLSPGAYRVLRKGGTEAAGSHVFNRIFPKQGYFACAGCDHPLYSAKAKFKEHSGWPAWDKCLYSESGCHVGTRRSGGATEMHCMQCGGHLGHIFYGEGFTNTNERH